MSSKINILVEIKDLSLRDRLASLLAEDWARPWNIIDSRHDSETLKTVAIAVVDSPAPLSMLEPSVPVIFLGEPQEPARFFATLNDKAPESLLSAVKRAFSYREITRQNKEALYPQMESESALQTVAQSLTARLHQLVKLSEMRVALVDQMPVGVLGIDDENNIVLANPKAIQLLGMEDIPIWGLSVDTIFRDKLSAFMSDRDSEEISITRYNQRIIIRKSPFFLENSQAGTILALWNPVPPENSGD